MPHYDIIVLDKLTMENLIRLSNDIVSNLADEQKSN